MTPDAPPLIVAYVCPRGNRTIFSTPRGGVEITASNDALVAPLPLCNGLESVDEIAGRPEPTGGGVV